MQPLFFLNKTFILHHKIQFKYPVFHNKSVKNQKAQTMFYIFRRKYKNSAL